VSLLDAAQTVEEEKRVLATIEREVDRERMEVEQAIALARIEPRARAAGLDRIEAEAVMLLATGGSQRVPEARPLGAPGAGARGSWFHRVWSAARVAAAAAAVEEQEKAGRTAGGVSSAPSSGGQAVAGASGPAPAAHPVPIDRCDICRARAAGRNVSH
jgi:hypothetical protein